MKNHSFTGEDLLNKVKELGNRHPDYVYIQPRGLRTCSYVRGESALPDGTEGCIMGVALRELGMTAEELQTNEETEDDEFLGISVSDMLDKLNITASEETLKTLNTIQNAQDAGMDWDVAVRAG